MTVWSALCDNAFWRCPKTLQYNDKKNLYSAIIRNAEALAFPVILLQLLKCGKNVRPIYNVIYSALVVYFNKKL